MDARWMALLLVLPAVAGCMGTDDVPEAAPFPLEVYRFAWEGSDTHVEGTEHGWLVRFSNPTDRAYQVSLLPSGVEEALLGPVSRTAGEAARSVWLPIRIEEGQAVSPTPLRLGPGESGIFLAKVSEYKDADAAPTGFRAFVTDSLRPQLQFDNHAVFWNVTRTASQTTVAAGDHVRTVTVGVWTNGTSFYTNSADLLADPAFPAGFDRNESATDPLPVYVYARETREQPAASVDHCYFVTIRGYNALLGQQAEGSTGVRLLQPEDAYTREGNEDHFLYGSPLVFVNTVVAHDGSTDDLDAAPDPEGPCFPASIDRLLAGGGLPTPALPLPEST